jgi:acetylornithine deacetylase/succinyl-diaminopimelate desuccinylase-like protein
MLKGSTAERVLDRLERIYRIGRGEGANRPGFSPEEQEAIDLAASWMDEAGLEVETDATGNVVGRLLGERPDLPEVWTGSHLDSVPSGGRFDGALGVVGGLEAVESVGRQQRTLGVVVFRAEETGCQGSRAATRLPGAFVELHVEQGRRLETARAPLGVVTGIVGYLRRTVVFRGVGGHAGTTPMSEREDALVKAAEFILHLRHAAAAIDGAVATVGRLEVEPGAVNVIPGRVTATVDLRAPDADGLARLAAAAGVDVDQGNGPVPMSEDVRAVLREELTRRGLSAPELVSWAGHDAGILAAAGVESGMLFVRSLAGGASHCPEEESSAEDIELAVDVLAATLEVLSSRGS